VGLTEVNDLSGSLGGAPCRQGLLVLTSETTSPNDGNVLIKGCATAEGQRFK
jgi:hypothetical protein